MNTITLEIKTTKARQEIKFDFGIGNSSSSKFQINWGDGTTNTQSSHTYELPTGEKLYTVKITTENNIDFFECNITNQDYRETDKYGIKSIDFSQCKNIKKITCNNHPLDKLNIEGCTAVEYIDIQNCLFDNDDLGNLYEQLPQGNTWNGNTQSKAKVINVKYNYKAYLGEPRKIAEDKGWAIEYLA